MFQISRTAICVSAKLALMEQFGDLDPFSRSLLDLNSAPLNNWPSFTALDGWGHPYSVKNSFFFHNLHEYMWKCTVSTGHFCQATNFHNLRTFTVYYMGESSRIIPEFSILRLTFHRKSASKC